MLFKGKGIISWLIKRWTDSEYSHVAVCVAPKMNLAIEAVFWGGVRARDIRKIKEEYDVYGIKEEHAYNLEETTSYLVSKLNKWYDPLGVLYLGLLRIKSFLKPSTKSRANKWQMEHGYFCSELCYLAFDKGGGLDIVPQIEYADITSPGDIAKSMIIEKIIK